MANPVRSQIIGSFEDIGKSIVNEVAKVPGDIAGKAMESLGASSGKTQPGKTAVKSGVTAGDEKPKTNDTWDTIDSKDKQIKQVIARQALADLLQRSKPIESSVWEKKQQEEKQKKEFEEAQKKAVSQAQVPQTGTKRPRGDLYGMKAKKNPAEIGKNVKSD